MRARLWDWFRGWPRGWWQQAIMLLVLALVIATAIAGITGLWDLGPPACDYAVEECNERAWR